jgi:hypothetical protein
LVDVYRLQTGQANLIGASDKSNISGSFAGSAAAALGIQAKTKKSV